MDIRKISPAQMAAAILFGATLSVASAAEPESCRPTTTDSQIQQVGHRRVYCPPCPPQPVCPPPATDHVQPAPMAPSVTPTPADDTVAPPAPSPVTDDDVNQSIDNFMNQPVQQPAAPPANNLALASTASSAGGANSFAPGMIGDYFGTGGSGGFVSSLGFFSSVYIPGGGVGAPQARVGVQKLSEGTSPIPRDRFILNYSSFHNANLGDPVDVNRGVIGFEKTFNCGQSSIELRLPFADTVSSNIDAATPLGGQTNAELGDLTLYFKQVLSQSCTYTLAGGLGVSIPTSDDVFVYDGANFVQISSESVHLYPYIGSLWTPNDRLFVQNFLQFDIDANGNTVSNGTTAVSLKERDDLYISTSLGYWIYQDRSCCSTSLIQGIAPQVELHYNQSITNGDSFNNGDLVVGQGDDISLLNATLGVTVAMRNHGFMTVGYSVPVTGDEQFDGEFRLMFSKPLGRGGCR